MPVTGVIIKFNKHGALASIEEGVAGLVHVSEFGSEEKLRKALELGKTYPFKITFSIRRSRRWHYLLLAQRYNANQRIGTNLQIDRIQIGKGWE